jgi:hypothetical protein
MLTYPAKVCSCHDVTGNGETLREKGGTDKKAM